MAQIALWTAAALAVKMLADVIRRRYGFDTPGRLASARRSIETDAAYGIVLAIALFVVREIGLDAALIVVIVLRLAAIAGDRVLLPGNHTFLELFLAVVCLRLYETPVALASVLQVITVSVWFYAAVQKLYQREYLDGTYFYLTLSRVCWRLGTWTAFLQTVPRIDGNYGALDASAQTFCRRLAVLVLIGEAVPPILAFAMTGSIWSVLLLLVVAVPVGVFTSETNFMLTNLLLAAVFLVPFDGSAFAGAWQDPVVAVVVGWCLVWPPIHAVLARRLRFSPWKLAGWGMYSRQKPRIDVVVPGGTLHPLPDSMPARLVREFGACRVGWLRDAIRRHFFRWSWPDPASGLAFRWYQSRGDRYVTSGVLCENSAGTPVQPFEIVDEGSAAAFARQLALLTPPASSQAVIVAPVVDATHAPV